MEYKNSYLHTSLNNVNQALEKEFDIENLGLLNGVAGAVLFYYEYYTLTKEKRYKKLGSDLLDHILTNLGSLPGHSFGDGLAGICWLLNYLTKEKHVAVQTALIDSVDLLLQENMRHDLRSKSFGYPNGILGIGTYFTEKTELNLSASYCLTQIILALENNCIEDEFGIHWPDLDSDNNGMICSEYGLTNNVSNVLVLLVRFYRLGILQKSAIKMINGVIKNLLCNISYLKTGPEEPRPTTCGKNEIIHFSRLARHFRDLKDFLAIASANQVLRDVTLEKKLDEFLLNVALKTDYIGEGTTENGIYYGSAGAALLYQQFFRYTGSDICSHAANYWHYETAKSFSKEEQQDLNHSPLGNPNKLSVSNSSLISGTVGIGLSLIGAIKGESPWMRMLLVH